MKCCKTGATSSVHTRPRRPIVIATGTATKPSMTGLQSTHSWRQIESLPVKSRSSDIGYNNKTTDTWTTSISSPWRHSMKCASSPLLYNIHKTLSAMRISLKYTLVTFHENYQHNATLHSHRTGLIRRAKIE